MDRSPEQGAHNAAPSIPPGLKELGLIDRIVEPTTPVSVRYRLTVRGQDLLASLQPLVAYGQRWERAPEASQPEASQPEASQPEASQPEADQPGR